MLGRIPWAAIVISTLVVISSGFPRDPIQDAATGTAVPEAFLSRSAAYVLLAPLSDVLDMLTLLSKLQHIAILAAALALFAVWRVVRAVRGRATVRGHLLASGTLLLGIVVVYAAMALLPRPMASLVADNADIMRVDFHSHTDASHDGRPGWSAERNRAWHRDGGYDVAYVTDHASVAGAERGMANNPSRAADDVVLLQGIEVGWSGEHVNVLGAGRTYGGLLTNNGRDLDPQALRLASLIPQREPVVVWNHPRRLDRLPSASGAGTSGVRAIELSNGAPDSMDGVRRERRALIALAEQKHLAMTAGSDNHGWGRTAPNWTLMVVPGWRGLSPDALATRIESIARRGGPDATRVVERRAVEATKPLAIAATIVTAPAMMLATLSTDERVSWLAWTWLITIGVRWIRRQRARALAP